MAGPNNEGFINRPRPPVLVITREHVDKALNLYGYLSTVIGILSGDIQVLLILSFLFFYLSTILACIAYAQGPVEVLGLNAITLFMVVANLTIFFNLIVSAEQRLDRLPPPT